MKVRRLPPPKKPAGGPVAVYRGTVGWSNGRGGVELYGMEPDGQNGRHAHRTQRQRDVKGHLLADDIGEVEGAHLILVVVESRFEARRAAAIAEAVANLMGTVVEAPWDPADLAVTVRHAVNNLAQLRPRLVTTRVDGPPMPMEAITGLTTSTGSPTCLFGECPIPDDRRGHEALWQAYVDASDLAWADGEKSVPQSPAQHAWLNASQHWSLDEVPPNFLEYLGGIEAMLARALGGEPEPTPTQADRDAFAAWIAAQRAARAATEAKS